MSRTSTRRQRALVRTEAGARLREPSKVDDSPRDERHALEVRRAEVQILNGKLEEARRALRRATDRFDALYHLAPAGYLTLSRDGVIAEANLTAAGLLGVPRQALPGTSFSGFVDGRDVERWSVLLRSVWCCGERLECTLGIRSGSGRDFSGHLACEGRPGDAGTCVVEVVLTDATAEATARQEARRNLESLEIALAEVDEGYWDWEVEQDRVRLGRAMGALLGLPEDNVESPRNPDPAWKDRYHPEDRHAVETLETELLQGSRTHGEVEVRIQAPGRAWRWIRLRGTVVRRDASGRARRIVGTASDVTEVRRLRETLHRSEGRAAHYERILRNLPGVVIGTFDHRGLHPVVAGEAAMDGGPGERGLAGRLARRRLPPGLQGRVDAAIAAALAGRGARVTGKVDGRAVELTTGPVLDAEGRVAMGVVSMVDVTGRSG